MNLLFELFITFFKIGLFTFGGGYAMISVIEDICVEKKQWITHDDMMNVTVIAESTPGPIAINLSTFVGYKKKGLAGAVASTVGVVLPSLIIIYVISLFLDNFLEITVVANAFKGIKLAVGLLIVDAAVKMIKKMKNKTALPISFMVGATLVMMAVNIFALKFSSIAIMLACACISIVIFLVENKRKAGDK